MHEKKIDIVECATAFAVASAGVLFLALVPGALGIRQTQKSTSVQSDCRRLQKEQPGKNLRC